MSRRVATAGQPPIRRRREMQSALGHGCLGLGRRNSRTITTVGRRQTGRAVRPVQGSVLVAMVDPVRRSPRSASRNNPGSPRDQPSRSRHAGHHGVESRLSRRTARMRAAYVRASLCAPVSCPYAWGAYAWPAPARHMRLLCWRLARSVRVCRCPRRPNPGGDTGRSNSEQP
jgi:hypothetical protein